MITVVARGTLTAADDKDVRYKVAIGQCSVCEHQLILSTDAPLKCIQQGCECNCGNYLSISEEKKA